MALLWFCSVSHYGKSFWGNFGNFWELPDFTFLGPLLIFSRWFQFVDFKSSISNPQFWFTDFESLISIGRFWLVNFDSSILSCRFRVVNFKSSILSRPFWVKFRLLFRRSKNFHVTFLYVYQKVNTLPLHSFSLVLS